MTTISVGPGCRCALATNESQCRCRPRQGCGTRATGPADPESAVHVEPHVHVRYYCNQPLGGNECRIGRLFASAASSEGGQRSHSSGTSLGLSSVVAVLIAITARHVKIVRDMYVRHSAQRSEAPWMAQRLPLAGHSGRTACLPRFAVSAGVSRSCFTRMGTCFRSAVMAPIPGSAIRLDEFGNVVENPESFRFGSRGQQN